MSTFWHLKYLNGFYNFGKFVYPLHEVQENILAKCNSLSAQNFG